MRVSPRTKLRRKLRPFSLFNQARYTSQLIAFVNREYDKLEKIPASKYAEVI